LLPEPGLPSNWEARFYVKQEAGCHGDMPGGVNQVVWQTNVGVHKGTLGVLKARLALSNPKSGH
jgi:hypothetical protein